MIIPIILIVGVLCVPSLLMIHQQVLRGDSFLLFEDDILVWFYINFINNYKKPRNKSVNNGGVRTK